MDINFEKIEGKVIIIFGPTASGKTSFSYEIAHNLKNCVIINADAMQMYSGVPIITNQPPKDYLSKFEHKLFAILPVNEKTNVASWLELAKKEINKAKALNKTPILVGGTGMYLKALIFGIDNIPKISNETKQKVSLIEKESLYQKLKKLDETTNLFPNDTQRVKRALEVILETGKPISYFQTQAMAPDFKKDDFYCLFLNKPRQNIYENINSRFDEMIKNGAIDEVKTLLSYNLDKSYPIMKAHGVPELKKYLEGNLNLQEATQKAKQNTRNYAKRQYTFFRTQLGFFQSVF
jgi:tRNA dimethylallyltransferase